MLLAATTMALALVSPPAHGTFDYQIGGAYQPASSVSIVDRDWHASATADRYSICYVNAFQTQPEGDRWWKAHHPHLLLRDTKGHLVEDPGWPGELLLDTSTAKHRNGIAAIVGSWMHTCHTKSFDAVEPDNLDSYTRSHRLLTRHDNLALARLLVGAAHSMGLAIAQKNGADLATTGHDDIGFDFAIAEECQVYRECASYRHAYGRHMIEIEYTDNGRQAFTAACGARGDAVSVVLRDRDVVPRGHRGYVERWCPSP
ncbi:MAG: hypothetical protein QOF18_2716 [Frankiaceae bacterium]|nr:hypothetical protein [Frankiaceae bacterium]